MIESVDDMMVLLQEHSQDKPEDKTVINLIVKGNNLTAFLYELIEAGYESSITYDAGRLTSIGTRFFNCKIIIIIKT